MQEELKLSKYQDVVSIVLKNDGCIFGGFLRDYAMQKNPRDLDIVLYYSKLSQFDNEVKLLGYHTMDDLEDDELEYTCDEKIPIHVVIEKEEDEHIRLSPCPIPDYDVNLLALDSKGLFNWMDSSSDPSITIQKIHVGIASAIKPTENRIAKFKLMGFTEIPYVKPVVKKITSYEACKKEILINKLATKRVRKAIEKTKALIQEQEQKTQTLKAKTQELKQIIEITKRLIEERDKKTEQLNQSIEKTQAASNRLSIANEKLKRVYHESNENNDVSKRIKL